VVEFIKPITKPIIELIIKPTFKLAAKPSCIAVSKVFFKGWAILLILFCYKK